MLRARGRGQKPLGQDGKPSSRCLHSCLRHLFPQIEKQRLLTDFKVRIRRSVAESTRSATAPIVWRVKPDLALMPDVFLSTVSYLNPHSLNLIEGNFVGAPVVKLCSASAGVISH